MKLIFLKTLVLEKYITYIYISIFLSYQRVSREYEVYKLKIIKELGKLTP
jgi:hypothetical protein